ncbi:sodium/hydrogen exchanger [Westerdykella ornata]|uniref:Sodium/hydrogen exchanger n=1 Tax=Westerdykella ornata TaxID=318751 RepID=A0A6A6JDU5_WESOR|nr:sodium/hydrogen exchanger [Westerdykella ornata]KAF2273816.1 sodium/hydrogen exchanger [Westerdykella ornata]
MASQAAWALAEILKREADNEDDDDQTDASQKEKFTSWALSILIVLLIIALFTSYILQTRKIQAVHETVLSIFAGMGVGLILRLWAPEYVQGAVSFDYQFFFNLLLPPIILSSGYELHQGNFFRHIGTILTFAFAGTFISALVLGVLLFLWTQMHIDGLKINFVEAMSVGATLSATDPVTILAIFNTYKVEPKLYTVIFGESILNDAIAIVLFETAQKYSKDAMSLSILSLFEAFGVFLGVFFGSLVIGVMVGVAASLMLKFTYVRRFPKTESCLIVLIAYVTYFFSNGISMSGIVSLLFCGICMKHYAYLNMSRRTQLTTKFVFQVTAQLSENFIFIYLGLSLFTDDKLVFKPLFILVAVAGICAARWCAVFPLAKAINSYTRYRQRKAGQEVRDELPYSYQAMIFWAGLRGAVGVALAAGLTGTNGDTLRATVLVVVVLTVIIFGGTTARMLEILGIKTGVIEEIDSDDEFDIEVIHGGTYSRHKGQGFGHNPRMHQNGFALTEVNDGSYSSGSLNRHSPPSRPNLVASRRSSSRAKRADGAEQGLLSPGDSGSNDEDDMDLGLPPSARRSPNRAPSPLRTPERSPYPTSGSASRSAVSGEPSRVASATGAVKQLFSDISQDPAAAFKQIDEGFLKPHLLLDPKGSGPSNV